MAEIDTKRIHGDMLDICERLSEIRNEADDLISELRRGTYTSSLAYSADAYGVSNFGCSLNPLDTSFQTITNDLAAMCGGEVFDNNAF